MRKRIGKIGALLVLGMFMMLMLAGPAAATDYDTDGDGYVGNGGWENANIYFDDSEDDIYFRFADVAMGRAFAAPETEVHIRSTDDITLRLQQGVRNAKMDLIVGGSWVGIDCISTVDGLFTIYDDREGVFHIQANDNVGIGTMSPQNRLDVEGAVAIGATYSGTSSAPSNGAIIEGNVGIGVISPTQKLHVSGNVRITGAIYDSNNDAGTNGQVLSSTATGTGTDWITLADNDATNELPLPGNDIDVDGTPARTVHLEDDIDVSIIRATGSGGLTIYDDNSNLGIFVEDEGNVGIGTASPVTTLDVDGGFATNVYHHPNTDSTYDVTNSDYTILVDPAPPIGTWVTLPSAVGIDGQIYIIKNVFSTMGTRPVYILTTGSQNIDSYSSFTLGAPWEVIQVQAYDGNWHILSHDTP